MQNTSVNLDYKDMVQLLAKETVISLIVLDSPTVFKRKLSMAKHRAGVDGKLDFAVEELTPEYVEANYGVARVAYSITVVLVPPKKPGVLGLGPINSGEI